MFNLLTSYEEAEALEDERLGIGRVWSYRDASGIDHESYEAACIYYGADTPAQLEAEARYDAAEEAIEYQDAMEARGGPLFGAFAAPHLDIPF
jgi:hypothetical protein